MLYLCAHDPSLIHRRTPIPPEFVDFVKLTSQPCTHEKHITIKSWPMGKSLGPVVSASVSSPHGVKANTSKLSMSVSCRVQNSTAHDDRRLWWWCTSTTRVIMQSALRHDRSEYRMRRWCVHIQVFAHPRNTVSVPLLLLRIFTIAYMLTRLLPRVYYFTSQQQRFYEHGHAVLSLDSSDCSEAEDPNPCFEKHQLFVHDFMICSLMCVWERERGGCDVMWWVNEGMVW